MIRILIPVLSFDRSGGYRVLSKMADEWIKIGVKVDFLAPDFSPDPYYPTKAGIIWTNQKGQLTRTRIEINKQTKVNWLSIQKCLICGLKNFKGNVYDVFLANQSITIYPLWFAGFKKKTVYYVQAYEPEMYDFMPGLSKRMIRWFSAFTYKMKIFTIVNADIYKKFKWLSASHVIYPGIDFTIFHPATITKPITEKIIIGTIGRLEKFKGTTYILDAFKEIRKRYLNAQLHVAFGSKEDWGDIEGVFYSQPHGDELLVKYYTSLDFYVSAGIFQHGAFHYPVAEAMACGIPVLTTPYYPANENNAWIIKPNSAADIVSVFSIAYTNKKLCIEKNAIALNDVKQFSWPVAAQKMFDLIKMYYER